jgi:hypothetical protein
MGGPALFGAFLILSTTGVAAAPISLRVTSSGVTSARHSYVFATRRFVTSATSFFGARSSQA